MKLTTALMTVAATLCISSLATAGDLDVGARYGRTIEQDGNNLEVAARYFPIPFLSLGASLGYANLRYDKGLYYKKADTMPLGGYANAHLPLIPFVKPYAGIGVLYYSVNNISSPNQLDRGEEHSGTMTVQGGADISLPLPKLSLNIEARRLINDRQTQLLGGIWFRF
ncbi:hypothetical protein FY034_04005 [Trichlorobacter lovleyi]|uniref:hypothetical protein n=1 Tax=Trichlorobacter lovleyi TaxID=313985 RepID=UPI00223F7650|nr:hypothetical protein [Trichlorobacter lovleyi]QOX78132.1 hypothetical protein FY034_04005 [Trichlorobacter lovleyi]